MKNAAWVLLIGLFLPLARGFAQGAPTAPRALDGVDQAQERLRLATTSEDYPVTPGDEYRLTYRQGDTQIASTVVVEGNYAIGLGLFGVVNASGMSFPLLKLTVEKLIQSGYPRSMPSLTPLAIGQFNVFVKGEMPRAMYFTAYGLSRISDVIDGIAAPGASLRKVEVISRDGTSHIYDLYAAMRGGKPAQNPYVRPGDSIVLSRYERKVQITGSVRMPGAYELLPGEQLRSLVDSYAGGMMTDADATRVSIRRVAGDAASVQYANLAAAQKADSVLMDGDVVTVSPKDARLPAVFIEGAVAVQAAPAGGQAAATVQSAAQDAVATYGRIVYLFVPGQTLSDALLAERGSISSLADLASAYVIRDGADQPTYVDLRELLSGTTSSSDLALRANDRIVIPFSNFSILVSGAVSRPGSYPYSPNRTYQYYVSLAGGNGQENPQDIAVTDRRGASRTLNESIQSEDQIYVTPVAPETIMVQGAVFGPGVFSYRAGSAPAYYISLAGGADPERNPYGTYVVFDSSGKKRGPADPLSPGDRIYLPNNGFVYNLAKYTPLVASILTTIWTVYMMYSQFLR